MEQRRYQNSIELIDLYKVVAYIIENDTKKSKRWTYYDEELKRKVLSYMNKSNDKYIVNVVNKYLEQGIIINLLSKIISPKDKAYLDSYLRICNEDTREFTHNLEENKPLEEVDIPDLYLYYVSRHKKQNKKTLSKVKARARVLN